MDAAHLVTLNRIALKELIKFVADDVIAVFENVACAYHAFHDFNWEINRSIEKVGEDMGIHAAIGSDYGPTLYAPAVLFRAPKPRRICHRDGCDGEAYANRVVA